MKPANVLWLAVIALVVAAFFAGMAEVMRLRTDLSGAFAEYSTYRADPLGAQVIYRALSAVPALQVERNEKNLGLFKGGAGSTLLLLGVEESPDPFKLIQHLESFMVDGGRLVLAYGMRARSHLFCVSPEEGQRLEGSDEPWDETVKRWIKRENVPAIEPPPQEKLDLNGGVLASERWGFRVVAPMSVKEFADAPPLMAKPTPQATFAQPAPWKSPEYFARLRPGWEVLYTRGEEELPLMMRRKFGKGELIVASDAYFASNEGMREARQPGLFVRLAENTSHIVFDESSKGVDRSPGVLALMKRYHLHLVIASMVLLAVLYVWRGAVSLVPRRGMAQERERALLLQGRDAYAGLAALLRRATPPDQVLEVCFNEWRQAFGRTRNIPVATIEKARRILSGVPVTPDVPPIKGIAERYRAAALLLRERRSKP